MTTPSEHDLQSVTPWMREAKAFLEKPSLLIKLANIVGAPLEKFQDKLPEKTRVLITNLTEKALSKALDFAIKSTPSPALLRKDPSFAESNAQSTQRVNLHTAASAVSGAVGGFLGPLTIAVELPIATTLMLRSICEAAQSYGYDIQEPEVKTECLFVFTLGSNKSQSDDEMNSAYLTTRLAFAKTLQEASATLAGKGATSALGRLITRVAARFEIAVSEKFVAQAVPIAGAVGGAAINIAFADYFGRAANYHFGMKALEDKYGKDVITEHFKKL